MLPGESEARPANLCMISHPVLWKPTVGWWLRLKKGRGNSVLFFLHQAIEFSCVMCELVGCWQKVFLSGKGSWASEGCMSGRLSGKDSDHQGLKWLGKHSRTFRGGRRAASKKQKRGRSFHLVEEAEVHCACLQAENMWPGCASRTGTGQVICAQLAVPLCPFRE